jgi:two-component system chemotaxis sensor kinase CheA
VQVAADGVEAWGLLDVGSCDLVVADIVMPGMDGLELTARIRADERFRDLPVVLVTSLASPEDRERGMTAGADAFIVKSEFDQELLLDVIRRLT